MSRQALNSPDYHVPIDGFSQVVEVPTGARLLMVSGLTSRTADGTIVGVGDPTAQMRQIFENLRVILASAGCTLDDVVSIRTYVTDIGVWDQIDPVWREHWGEVWPASTLVQISRLFDERQLIELEATVAKKEDR
jgi:enamine deaminase RidA (YjgF/YER057c/UK114 family)